MHRLEELSEAISEAVRRGTEGKRVGVATSGGLDSGMVSALASRYAESVTLYTCGTSGSYDVAMGKDLSERISLPWVHCPISKGSIESDIRQFIDATGETDPFTISYELQLFCVCREAEEDVIVTGQGADEYFMGCAKYVAQSPEDFQVLVKAGIDRLVKVSMPCEERIARHFGKTLVYPYMEEEVIRIASSIDLSELLPEDMDSRKAVLKEVAKDLGYGFLLTRRKKSSQYGSGTTDLVRALARERGMMYNEYIAAIYDSERGFPSSGRGSLVSVRIDPVLKAKAEDILDREGVTPSQAVEDLYRRIVEEGTYPGSPRHHSEERRSRFLTYDAIGSHALQKGTSGHPCDSLGGAFMRRCSSRRFGCPRRGQRAASLRGQSEDRL